MFSGDPSMTNRFCRLAVLGFVGALIAGLLTTSGAGAYSIRGIYPTSNTIAVYNNTGSTYAKTYVYVKCIARSTCYGSAAYARAGEAPRGHALWTSYSVAAGTGKYIIVKIRADQFDRVNAVDDGKVPGLEGSSLISGQIPGRLLFRETSPYKQELPKNVMLEQRQERRELKGTIDGPGDTSLNDLSVTLWKKGYRYRDRALSSGVTNFTFGNVALGYNNAPISDYRISVSATVGGQRREWFWRGPSGGGSSTGGSTDLRGASPVRVGKGGPTYDVPFNYGTISGNVSNAGGTNVKITVAGAPAVMPSTVALRRDLDVPYCAEIFGSTTTTGSYSVNFVPRGTDNKYLVKADALSGSAMTVWNNTWGSCLHARNYRYARDAGSATDLSRSNLISLGGSSATAPPTTLRNPTSGFSGNIDWNFSPGYYDRYVYVREYIPGMPVLNSPVVGTTVATSNGVYSLAGLPPGKYWLDIGRPVGVSGWYKSRYSNNATYLSSEADRQTEIWKSFSRLSSLPGTSTSGLEGIAVDHGASYAPGKQNSSPGSGYAGWMYRDFAAKYGQGYVKAITIAEGAISPVSPYISKGATITGHISREGGKTNKEMMVSVYSSLGSLVMRSAISNGSGNFKITGIAPGNYNVVVNSDSWRGLGRTFTGPHTKRVSGSGFYSVGTLYAKF